MAKPFRELRSRMSPAKRAEADVRTEQMIQELALHELRGARRLSQKALAETLATEQSGISRMERRSDMYISTLRSYVEAMGGELEIIARFGKQTFKIKKFGKLG